MNKKKIENYILNNFDKVKINSLEVLIGDVFIALLGENCHGANFIKSALDKGAKYIITDKVLEKNNINKNILILDNVLNFLNLIANKKRNLFTGKVIGITGSIGKTSVKENLKYFLENSFKVFASKKSYNNFLGVMLSLLNLNLESDYAIFEIGTSDFYEIRKLAKIIKPSQAIITNIHPTHLEKLINTKNIAEEKSDIFNPNYNNNIKLAILSNNNEDEKLVLKKAYKLEIFKIISFGKNEDSNIKILKIKYLNDLYSEININFDDKKIIFQIHNSQLPRINNFLICLGVFVFNKINLDIFSSLTKHVPLLAGRGLKQDIAIGKKTIQFIDESYNASPQSMKVTIDYFSEIKIEKNQRKFLILGDMQDLGNDSIMFHLELLRYIDIKKLENVIICGKFMQIALDKYINKKFKLMLDKFIILDYLKKNLSNNDILLIKGSNSSITNKIANDLIYKKEKFIV